MLSVNPPEYYPIIEKLFAARIKDALDAFGVSLEELRVFVQPEERNLNLIFLLKVRGLRRFFSSETNPFVYGLLEKLASDATATFGKLYGIRFTIAGFKVSEEEEREEHEGVPRLIVNAPVDMEKSMERLGKGLMITLKEWNVEFSSIALTVTEERIPRVRVVLRLEKILPKEEREALKARVEAKTRTYLKTLIKKLLPVEVKIIDPEDRALAIVMKQREEIEREAESLAENEDIKELMALLGKETPGS